MQSNHLVVPRLAGDAQLSCCSQCTLNPKMHQRNKPTTLDGLQGLMKQCISVKLPWQSMRQHSVDPTQLRTDSVFNALKYAFVTLCVDGLQIA